MFIQTRKESLNHHLALAVLAFAFLAMAFPVPAFPQDGSQDDKEASVDIQKDKDGDVSFELKVGEEEEKPAAAPGSGEPWYTEPTSIGLIALAAFLVIVVSMIAVRRSHVTHA